MQPEPTDPIETAPRDPAKQAQDQSELDWAIAQYTGYAPGQAPEQVQAPASDEVSWWQQVKDSALNMPFARFVENKAALGAFDYAPKTDAELRRIAMNARNAPMREYLAAQANVSPEARLALEEFDARTGAWTDWNDAIRDMPGDQREVATRLRESGTIKPYSDYADIKNTVLDYQEVSGRIERLERGWQENGFKSFTANLLGGFTDPVMIGVSMLAPPARGLTAATGFGDAARILSTAGAKNFIAFGTTGLAAHKMASTMNYDLTDQPGAMDDLAVFGASGGIGFAMPWAGYAARYGLAKLIDTVPDAVLNGTLPKTVVDKALKYSFGFDRTGENRAAVFELMNARLPAMGSLEPEGMSYSGRQSGTSPTRKSGTPNLGRESANQPASAGEVPFFKQHDNTLSMLDRLITQAENGTYYKNLNLVTLSKLGDDGVATRVAKLKELYAARAEGVRAEWRAYDDTVLAAIASGADPSAIAAPAVPRTASKNLKISVFDHNDQGLFDNIVRARQVLSNNKNNDAIWRAWSASGLVADLADATSILPLGRTPGSRLRTAPGLHGDIFDLISGAPEARAHDLDPSAKPRVSAEARKEALDSDLVASNRRISAILSENKGRSRVLGLANKRGSRIQQEAIDILIDEANAARGSLPSTSRNPWDGLNLTPAEQAQAQDAAVRIADEVRGYFRAIGERAVQVGLLPAEALNDGTYIPIMLNKARIKQDQSGFEAAILSQFRLRDSATSPLNLATPGGTVRTEAFIRPDALAQAWEDASKGGRGLRKKIVEFVRASVGDPTLKIGSAQDIRDALAKPSKTTVGGTAVDMPHSLPTISQLASAHPDIVTAYEGSLGRIHTDGARKLAYDLTAPMDATMARTGGATGTPPALRDRNVFNVVDESMRPFLSRDLEQVMRRYSSMLHGELAVAEMIQAHPEVFGSFRTSEGQPVRTASDLIDFLDSSAKAVTATSGTESGTQATLSGLSALSKRQRSAIEAAITSANTDTKVLVQRLVGQTPFASNAMPEAQLWASNVANRATMLRSGGMIGINNSLDLAGMMFRAWESPKRMWASLGRSLLGMTNDVTNRDLQYMGMMWQNGRLNIEMDAELSGLGTPGIGSGPARATTEAVDRGMRVATNRFSDVNLINQMNNVSRRAATIQALGDAIEWSKTLSRAVRQVGNTTDGVAIREAFVKLGGSEYQLGRLSKMGIKAGNVDDLLIPTYNHGVTWDGSTAIRSRMTFDEFLADTGANMTVVDPNFSAWADRNTPFMREFVPAVQNEARRSYHVSPGVADRPIGLDRYPVLRSVNMFYSYLLAAGPQRLRTWAEMPVGMQARAWAAGIFSGWMYQATMNHVTKRQSFSDSVREVVENPGAAIYKGVMQSGIPGALSRPLGWLDTWGVGLGTLTGTNYTPGSAGATQREMRERRFGVAPPDPMAWLKPVAGAGFSYADDAVRGISSGVRAFVTGQKVSPQQEYLMSTLYPGQNLWAFRGLNFATDAAFGTPIGRVISQYSPAPGFSLSSEVMRPPPRTANPYR